MLRYLDEHIARSGAEPGCREFRVERSAQRPLEFDVDERFDSPGSFRADQERVGSSVWGAATAGIERDHEVQVLARVAGGRAVIRGDGSGRDC